MFGVSKEAVISGLYQASELRAKLFSKELEILRLKAESEYFQVLDELLRIKDSNTKLVESGLAEKLEQEKLKWNGSQLMSLEQRIESVRLLIEDCHAYVRNVKSSFDQDDTVGYTSLNTKALEQELESLSFAKVLSSSAKEYFYNSLEYELYTDKTPNIEFLYSLKEQISLLYENRAA
ncbi:DNA repair protein [Vibrio campbellii]|uniref:DNA repair protein n=1 Tax=Vibrio campbellii TaxID=680 RepID=A0AAQ3AYM5_9VIBR|nr:DNA repair protein [Vibrio campbellii]WDG07006.1 DNA repair protein [Vibrio campbellii]